jgi:hypothetical protein
VKIVKRSQIKKRRISQPNVTNTSTKVSFKNIMIKASLILVFFTIIVLSLIFKDDYIDRNDNLVVKLLTTPDPPINPLVLEVKALSEEIKITEKEMENLIFTLDELIQNNESKEDEIQSLKNYLTKLKSGQVSTNVNYIISQKIDEAIEKASVRYDVDKALIRAVIKQESNFNVTIVSHAGAQGLMQLMPDTARLLGVKNVWDIEENIMGGTQYLRDQLKIFGDLKLALAAYNAGTNAVKKYNGIPPFRETQDYVVKVINYYNAFK